MTKTEIKKMLKDANLINGMLILIENWYDKELNSIMVQVFTLSKDHIIYKDLYRIEPSDKSIHYICCKGCL